MGKSLRWTGGVLLLLVCCGWWLVVAMDYGESAAVGKYRFTGNGAISTLVLKPDHTFQQDLQIGSNKQHSEGTWHRVGEGGISFSKDFIAVSGDEPSADGSTFCDMHKTLGLFLSLQLRQYYVYWYSKTKPGSEDSVLGTYSGDEESAPAELVVKADHSFEQTVTLDGVVRHASGTWSQAIDGTIRFSNAFLKTSGEPLKTEETASTIGSAGPELQIDVDISAQIAQPIFRKQLIPW